MTQYGILFAFGGIYYGIESESKFDKSWFLADFQAYAWGIAISLAVNFVVFPVTAESQLKQLLVTSLQHVSTLAHLSCKTYSKEITQDEAVSLEPSGLFAVAMPIQSAGCSLSEKLIIIAWNPLVRSSIDPISPPFRRR